MNNTTRLLITAAAAAMISGAAMAQSTAFDIRDSVSDAIDDLEEDIEDDFDRELDRFGNEGRELGWTGTVSARATATSGNTDTADIGVGARLGYFDGLNGHEFLLSYSFSEDSGVNSRNRVLAGYDYTREFGSDFYAFGKLVYAYDEFATYETDAFAGVGVGYRIINDSAQQWSIQAGPGWREAETAAGATVSEVALSVSSDYSYRFSDTLTLTNDTDILTSESDTYVANDLGLNVAMSDVLALRTSVLTEYRSDPLPGFEKTDNTFGVSVVYSFN